MATSDIRQTGFQNYRDLQEQNAQVFNPETATAEDWYKHLKGSSNYNNYSDQPTEYVGLQAAEAGYGDSQYDEGLTSASQFEDLGDIRYENQPWYDTLANGLGKMLGTAGTTFVSSLVGLPYGLYEAANQGRWSALWDNDVTQGLSDVDNWLEENLTNYRSQVQQNSPWYSPDNLFSMNFIADDVIKNAGFTLGAAASMAVGSGTLGLMGKALGFVNEVSKPTKMAAAAMSALFSATGEGMIEAKQGVNERNKLETQRLEDSLVPEYNALQMQQEEINQRYRLTGDYETYKQDMTNLLQQKEALEAKKNAGLQQIEESGQRMGNTILLANQALLTAGNLIQFGKGMVKSFDSARHAAEISSKAAKPFGVRAVQAGTDLVRNGYKIVGKNLGKTAALTKGILTEGSEEMNQQWIQSASGAAYNEADVNDYWKARLDPEAYRDTTEGLYTLGKVLDRGFQESWGDVNQWEQFVIGGLTGMAGSYTPTKLFNQDKTKSKWDPRRYGSWEGGAYNSLKKFNEQYGQFEENVNEVNKILQSEDFPERVQDMVGHTYTETEKTAAVDLDDKKAWKDADDKQIVHDIQSFIRAGKLDDLRTIYKELGSNFSDKDIERVFKDTTKVISDIEDKQNHDRMMDERIAAATDAEEKEKLEAEKEAYVGHGYSVGPYVDSKGNHLYTNDEMREVLKHNSEELDRKLDSYLESVDEINRRTHGALTKDQEDNLVYLHNVAKEKDVRFNKIMQNVRKRVPSKFLIKTSKTPEQLMRENASSDLAFTRNENTPEGYVEVDTSLINDAAFASFFAENVIWGQNIRPSFTKEEVAEELKAQEEDKKYSKEEQKKRQEERAKKQAEKIAQREQQSEKDRKEQQDKNLALIRQAFVENAMNKEGMSLYQAIHSDQLDNLFNDINDALMLRNEASEYEDTLMQYLADPSKADKAKEKAAKEGEKKEKQKVTDSASLDDMLKMSDVDLGAILSDGKKGKNKAGNKARKAIGMKNGRTKLKKELDSAVRAGTLDEDTAEDALKLFDEQLSRMALEEDEADLDSMDKLVGKMFDTDTEAMNDGEALLTDNELQALEDGAELDEAALDERVSRAKDAINKVSDKLSKELREIEDSIDIGTFAKALDDDNPMDKADKEVAKMSREDKDKNSPTSNPKPKRNDEPSKTKPVNNPTKTKKQAKAARTTSSGETQALVDDKNSGEKGDNIPQTETRSNWHPWMSSTSEVGQRTNVPYEPNPSDPNAEFKKKRYDVIRKKLEEAGAYTARKEGKIKPDMKVGFKVFQEVNDEAGDFVIFITDEHGNIIGDMPSNDPRLDTSKRDVSMDAIYRKIQEEFDDVSDEEKKNGMQSKYFSQVDHVLVGKVRYQEEQQAVSSLFEGSGRRPQFAIKVGSTTMFSPNVGGVNMPLTGNIGQPYVLIQTPRVMDGLSGFRYYAVPIHTMRVADVLGKNTMFEKALRDLLQNMKRGRINDAEAQHLLSSLLALNSVHVNLDEGSDTKKTLGIRVTTFDRTSNVEKGVPYTIYEGTRENMDVDAIIGSLVGQIPEVRVNVSGTYINGGSDSSDKFDRPIVEDYNAMIAEVAETNAAEPVTVNNWFTVRPLEGNAAGGLSMIEQKDKLPSWEDMASKGNYTITPQLKDKSNVEWTVNPQEGFTVYDENGKPIESGDKHHTKAEKSEAHKLAAEVFGIYHLRNMDSPYACVIEGKTYVYNPVNRTFKTPKEWEKSPQYRYKVLKEAERNGTKLTEEQKYNMISAALAEQYIDDYLRFEEENKNERDRIDKVAKALKAMEDDSSHYHLVKWNEEKQQYVQDANGDYYQDDRDQSIHARVSNINRADEEVIEANKKANFTGKSPAFIPSTAAGNVVDRFVREYFKGGDPLEGWTDKEIKENAAEIADRILNTNNIKNVSNKDALKLVVALHEFKKSLGADWVINSTGIVASGIVSFDKETSVNVAGTIDLLAYNPKTGQYAIIDMKTHLGSLFDKKGKLKTDAKTQAKIAHWKAQQTLYKDFLESKFGKLGVNISGIRIMPFSVSYNTKFTETDYTVDNGVLKDKGHIVDINPKYDGKLIQLTAKEEVKYNVAQLPESVKRLMPSPQKPLTRKPEDKKLPLKEKLINIANRIPEGRSMVEFLKKDLESSFVYGDVVKLAEIVDSNKNSNSPVLMTMASQNLLLSAIDEEYLDAEVMKEKAAKHKILLDIPKGGEQEYNDVLEGEAAEVFEELSEELQQRINGDKKLLHKFIQMVDAGMDTQDIEIQLNSPIRHKKATTLPYQKLDLQKEMKWLTRNLPQLSKERKVQIIEGLVRCSDGSDDFGRFENNIIMIGTSAASGTVYHEAFHAVVQMLLTDDEINKLYSAARKKYGNMPEVALEERLADDFEDYVRGLEYEDNSIKRFFRELWNTIKAILGNKSYIETLYRDINTGVYTGREFKDNRNNAFSNVDNGSRELTKTYEYLTDEERDRLNSEEVDRDRYNSMTKEQQEYMLHCVV